GVPVGAGGGADDRRSGFGVHGRAGCRTPGPVSTRGPRWQLTIAAAGGSTRTGTSPPKADEAQLRQRRVGRGAMRMGWPLWAGIASIVMLAGLLPAAASHCDAQQLVGAMHP